jgi:hypothetical protein
MIKSCNIIMILALLLFPLAAATEADEKTDKQQQPVLIVLYSRFDDHISIGLGEDRVFRLLELVKKLRKEYPSYPVVVHCEFSGTFAQTFGETPTGKGYMSQLKELAKAGAVEFGYSGEHEPTYRNRPKAVLTKGMTPEQKWLARTNAAERFLNDYKDPLTGAPDPKRPGGLRQVMESYGEPAIIGYFAPELGGEAPYYHQLRRMKVQAVTPGFPDPYFTMNIHGYRASATEVGAKSLVPVPEASSELFWDSNFLRASFTSSADIRRFSADEGKEALETLLSKLDRSRVRLLQIEVCGYSRYLSLWPDGTPKMYPLVWTYDHPDDPILPGGIRAFNGFSVAQKGYAVEDEALRWLFSRFLPANSGSRIVDAKELLKMAQTPVNSEVSVETLREAVRDWITRSTSLVNMSPTFVQAGGKYYSAADLFQLLANSLAGMSRTGKTPEQIRLTNIYGPLDLEQPAESAPTAVFSASAVMKAAAELAPKLNDQTWLPVPLNAVPWKVELAGKPLNPAQFLALMVDAYQAGKPDAQIHLRYLAPGTSPGEVFPRQNASNEGGHTWTLRPAPLTLH